MHPDEITGDIIELAIALHRELGPGLLESVYEAILEYELKRMGYHVRRQQAMRFKYDDLVFKEAFRADLIVNDTVIIEVKSVARLDESCPAILLTYAKVLRMPVGLILNFGMKTMLAGIKRLVNNMPPFDSSRVRINRSGRGATKRPRLGTDLPAPPAFPASPREPGEELPRARTPVTTERNQPRYSPSPTERHAMRTAPTVPPPSHQDT